MRTLYRAGRVHTLSYPAVGEWVLVDERHVQRVGSGDPPEADRIVELPGATIIPGFIDSHVHLTGTGIDEAGPHLGTVGSAAELVGALAEAARSRSGVVLAHGFDETKWPVPDLPTIDELDKVADRPVIAVRTDGHIALGNRAALGESGALGLPGVELDERGEPTGVVRMEANARLQAWWHENLPDREIQELQLGAAALAASRGVTCVHEMAMPLSRGLRDFEVLMSHREQLPVDVVVYLATMDIPYVIDAGLSRIGGDLSLDGSIGARTAHLADGYADGEGTGIAYFDDDLLCEFLHNAHLAGLQVAVHAIGDAAIEQAVRSWERVSHALDSRERRHFRARLHRIEHFEMPSEGLMERAAALGLALSVQPAFDSEWGHPGGMYERRLGARRSRPMNPFRTYLDRGMEVGAGSDSPVTPLDPMQVIRSLEGHHDPLQRLSRQESIALHTWGSARIAGLERKKGRLDPGMQADFAAYDDDPFAAETADLAELRPVLTVSLGREVYAR
ncbi:MAG: amidohydrolase [Actinobacteria bacterium]|nr:amidohydrolase [Actinomycetota bacterium]